MKQLTVEINKLAQGLKDGDRASIARCITVAEDDPQMFSRIIKKIYDPKNMPRVIGITGPPGCGKSTLISLLAPEIAASGHKIGIIAIDASSPFTGGSFLGNRIRMEETLNNSKIFMRSIATRGAKGGLSTSITSALITLSCSGFDLVLVESVGSGQADVDILNIASTILLVLAPGLGDEIQAMKAGTMEIADIFVINKAELPGADNAKRSILTYLSAMQGKDAKKVAATSCVSKQGIHELVNLILEHEKSVDTQKFISRAFKLEVDRIANDIMSKRFAELSSLNSPYIDKMLKDGFDPYSAAIKLLDEHR